ncbi:MAG: nucleotidyl transferase AbiEii/AbiGii toxin family protein [Chloracidobacterium sp.]|nr:nucleotidyl transferase AbiEii/AbiGii toxin family protein [Chloracidobacterium sp.]
MKETLPLATVHDAVLDFLRGRDDAVLFGAHAVNAYADEPRMTQDVDIMSTRAPELVEELREYLNQRFHIALRIRTIREGLGYRLYQVRKAGNRHLVDVRPVETLPSHRRVEDIQTIDPVGLIAGKVTAYHKRGDKPKAFTDRRDLAMLLLAFPDLKCDPGPVSERLREDGADEATLAAWREVVESKIEPQDEDSEFDY